MKSKPTKAEKSKPKNEIPPTTKIPESKPQIDQLDPALRSKVQQLIEMTQCSQDDAVYALHDCDNDVNAAANKIFELGDNLQDEWQKQKGKNKKKQNLQPNTTKDGADEEIIENANSKDIDDSVEMNQTSNENRTYPRNAPPRLQRGGNRRQDYRQRDGDSSDQGGFQRRSGNDRGDRGRGRGRGGARGRGSVSRMNNGPRGFQKDGDSTAPNDGSTPIGTWTGEAETETKIDNWGEMWDNEDQWTGDLKGTHVFESSVKTKTDFLGTAVVDQPMGLSGQSVLNGSSYTSHDVDTAFPKQQVEVLKPSTSSTYENHLAAEGIKSAIGMTTQSSTADKLSTGQPQQNSLNNLPQSKPSAVIKQQRSKVPPPSTKIPTAPVEMPHTATTIGNLTLQFGNMDFGDKGFTFDSSLSNTFSSDRPLAASNAQQPSTGLYSTGQSQSSQDQSAYPNSISQKTTVVNSSQPQYQSQNARGPPQSDLYGSSQASHNSLYSQPSSQFKGVTQPTSTASTHSIAPTSTAVSTSSAGAGSITTQSQSFQSGSKTSSNTSSYYSMGQQQTDSRNKSSAGATHQTPSTVQNTTLQYNNSLYTNTGDPHFSQYTNSGSGSLSNSGSSQQISSLGGASGHQQQTSTTNAGSRLSGQSATATKVPPNLPAPNQQSNAAMINHPGNYLIQGIPPAGYYNAPLYVDDMSKMSYGGYLEMNPYGIQTNSMASYTGSGSGDGKMTRIDAQSPTMQGAQSQTQQGSSSASLNQQHQYMSIPPGYAPYYYPNLIPNHGFLYQLPAVTQTMTLPGSNTTMTYPTQKSAGSANSSYYTGAAGYDEMSHSNDFSKGVYGASKPSNNLSSGAVSGADLPSMYKANSNTQSAVNSAAMYGAQAGYITAGHMTPQQQHIVQSGDSAMGGRAGQTSKQNSKSFYANWVN